MKNDPTKWSQQTWLIPGEAFLKRDGEKWALSVYSGLHVALDPELAERLAEHLAVAEERAVQAQEDEDEHQFRKKRAIEYMDGFRRGHGLDQKEG